MEITETHVTVQPGAAAPPASAGERPEAVPPDDGMEQVIEMAARMAAQKALEWSGRGTVSGGATEETPGADGPNAGGEGEARLAFAQELMRQEDEIRQTRPDFDLEETLRASNAFRALILAGEPVERALSYIEPEAGMKRAEDAVLERIRRRNARPQGMGQANRPAAASEPEEMSEEDLRRIDAQLKRGRKVYLK